MFDNEDIFSKLPIFWKVLIVVGFLTLFIMFLLIIVLIFLFSFSKEETINVNDYDEFLNEFESSKINNNAVNTDINYPNHPSYPNLPRINDLKGNPLRDLLNIEIINEHKETNNVVLTDVVE